MIVYLLHYILFPPIFIFAYVCLYIITLIIMLYCNTNKWENYSLYLHFCLFLAYLFFHTHVGSFCKVPNPNFSFNFDRQRINCVIHVLIQIEQTILACIM